MKQGLPAPRLQLRWAESTHAGYQWECHYELVMPLGQYDIRGEQEGPRGGKRPNLTEFVVAMKPPSLRGGTGKPCRMYPSGEPYYDPPFRDGSHAIWDSEALGGVPIYVIDLEGTAFQREPEKANP